MPLRRLPTPRQAKRRGWSQILKLFQLDWPHQHTHKLQLPEPAIAMATATIDILMNAKNNAHEVLGQLLLHVSPRALISLTAKAHDGLSAARQRTSCCIRAKVQTVVKQARGVLRRCIRKRCACGGRTAARQLCDGFKPACSFFLAESTTM